MKSSNKRYSVTRMVELSFLTAIVVLLQLTGTALRLPFLATPVSLVLIPIALGAMCLGPFAGAFLGFVFGAVVVIAGGIMGLDPFTATLFAAHPLLTVLTCVLKSTSAGLLAGLAYRAFRKKHPLAGSFVASAITPTVNTGVFILGCITMMDVVTDIAAQNGMNFFYFVVIGCAGLNFIFELILNLLFAPVLARLVNLITPKE